MSNEYPWIPFGEPSAGQQGDVATGNPPRDPVGAPSVGSGTPWDPPRPRPTRERGAGGWRAALIGGVVGAVVASGITAGILALDDDGGATRTRTVVRTEGSSRPSTVITEPGDIKAILDKVQPAVVRLAVDGSQGVGEGSGFIISDDGVIVTNSHVVAGADRIEVTLDTGETRPAEILGVDQVGSDLAVIKIDGEGLPVAELGDSDALQVGDQVVAIGNALGLDGAPSVTSGIVSALQRWIQEDETGALLTDVIQTDAAINPGNSGGPLVNASGEVVGINTAIYNPAAANNVGFAISISSAAPIIEDLREGRTPRVPFLGVATTTVDPRSPAAEELGVDRGAFVQRITPGSPADEAGIRRGDVVVEVAGQPVSGMEEVAREVRRHEVGETVEIVVVRDGDERTFEVELAERPENF